MTEAPAFEQISMTEEHRFPCESCGSDLRFEPGTDLLSCDHCGNQQQIEHSAGFRGQAVRELDFRRAIKEGLSEFDMAEIQTVTCTNCGAHNEFDADTHAAECPFCATPIVTGTGVERQIKPRGLLPFHLSEKEARQQMTDWLGRLWFAPSGLKAYARKGRKMSGVYVPYWTYDAQTQSDYTGQRGTVYYETRRVSVVVNGRRQMRTRQVPKIRWKNVRGRVARFFDDVLVLASQSLPKKYTDGLAPWDLSSMQPYRPEYLAGFRAEGYTVTLEDGYAEAAEHMNRMIERDVRFDIGGDRQQIDHISTDVGTLTFKHVLLPVWVAAYKYQGKTYRFVVNGRTGNVQGERPFSKWKIIFAILFGLIVAAIFGYMVAHGQNNGTFPNGNFNLEWLD
ncbi:primosomal protein N' (replication factor Y) - superfamily II helicase [Amylibacter kogurei]|uniref:Primosomal protein N' (Replication factor Y)-superfamily II helicase n=1 Tax=Paramylibacter kogurei TaxID=1889778 RepID=A0A2G5K3S6_9RHOB|nr:primosomal protein N' (replication factor Y) - superfamily II helicase [Amylibacter kogurei]PIB24196.1 primosomal protein N' (replication factor Y) - superfamily II helicase [Amylibacter kogurei]